MFACTLIESFLDWADMEEESDAARHELKEVRGRFTALEALCVVVLTRMPGGAAVERLRSFPAQVHRAVRFGMQHGAAVALMAAQLQSGQDLRKVALGIPDDIPEEEWEELAHEFYVTAEHAATMTVVDDVLNHVARSG